MKKIGSLVLSLLLLSNTFIISAFAEGIDDFQLAFYEDTIQDVENNTSIADAQDIKSGQTVIGRMRLPVALKGLTMPDGTTTDDYMDMDYFKFTLTQDSVVLLTVFPQTHPNDDYMIATISDASDSTLARTESFEDDNGWMSAIFDCELSAGTYYITFLCAANNTKYNGAEYMGYFEAVPASGHSSVPGGSSNQPTSSGSLSNFTKVNQYTQGQFSDVSASTWCAANVQTAFEYGLMAGKSDSYFDTDGNLTIAQAIVMACRLHNIYYGNNYTFQSGSPWYQDYVNYAIDHGIIESGYENYNTPVSRAGFAIILNGALPNSALQQINSVEDQSIPDVPAGSNYYNAVYRLYRAGILTGNDSRGTFTPFSYITRGAAAAIISRMADISLRREFTLQTVQGVTSIRFPVSSFNIDQGQTYTLTLTVNPSNLSGAKMIWASSNPAVATVSQSGVVTGISSGTATITAQAPNGVSAICTVKVNSNTTLPTENQGSSGVSLDINTFDFGPYAKKAYEIACLYAGRTIGVNQLMGGFSPNGKYVVILLSDRVENVVFRVRLQVGTMGDTVVSTFRQSIWDLASSETSSGAAYRQLNIGMLL